MSMIKKGFTLLELLVVISVVALLTAILMPTLGRVRQQGISVVCRSNIRQLHIANAGYSIANDGYYVRAARDMEILDDGSFSSGGMHRWHGVRKSDGVDPDPEKNLFEADKGPLSSYLVDGAVKECPMRVKFVTDGASNAFEAGGGGYGYNKEGVGSRKYRWNGGGADSAYRYSMRSVEISEASKKVMFTDSAFANGKDLIEYSFCEPAMYVFDMMGVVTEKGKAVPTIHFRHLGMSSVVWCDGHVSSEKFGFNWKDNGDERFGWFGPEDNSLFRP